MTEQWEVFTYGVSTAIVVATVVALIVAFYRSGKRDAERERQEGLDRLFNSVSREISGLRNLMIDRTSDLSTDIALLKRTVEDQNSFERPVAWSPLPFDHPDLFYRETESTETEIAMLKRGICDLRDDLMALTAEVHNLGVRDAE